MPKYNKRYRKRKYKKRRHKRRKNRMTVNVVRSPLMADTTYVKLKFFDAIDFSGSSTIDLQYRGNSAFDPAVSIITTQPVGFDKYKAMYSHYQVLGSSFAANLINLTTNPARISLIPTFSTTAINVDKAATNPYGKIAVLGSLNGKGQLKISNYMRSKKMFGRSTDSVNYSAPVTANPSNQWFWHFHATDLTLNSLDINGNITIVYYVKFWQRLIITDTED